MNKLKTFLTFSLLLFCSLMWGQKNSHGNSGSTEGGGEADGVLFINELSLLTNDTLQLKATLSTGEEKLAKIKLDLGGADLDSIKEVVWVDSTLNIVNVNDDTVKAIIPFASLLDANDVVQFADTTLLIATKFDIINMVEFEDTLSLIATKNDLVNFVTFTNLTDSLDATKSVFTNNMATDSTITHNDGRGNEVVVDFSTFLNNTDSQSLSLVDLMVAITRGNTIDLQPAISQLISDSLLNVVVKGDSISLFVTPTQLLAALDTISHHVTLVTDKLTIDSTLDIRTNGVLETIDFSTYFDKLHDPVTLDALGSTALTIVGQVLKLDESLLYSNMDINDLVSLTGLPRGAQDMGVSVNPINTDNTSFFQAINQIANAVEDTSQTLRLLMVKSFEQVGNNHILTLENGDSWSLPDSIGIDSAGVRAILSDSLALYVAKSDSNTLFITLNQLNDSLATKDVLLVDNMSIDSTFDIMQGGNLVGTVDLSTYLNSSHVVSRYIDDLGNVVENDSIVFNTPSTIFDFEFTGNVLQLKLANAPANGMVHISNGSNWVIDSLDAADSRYTNSSNPSISNTSAALDTLLARTEGNPIIGVNRIELGAVDSIYFELLDNTKYGFTDTSVIQSLATVLSTSTIGGHSVGTDAETIIKSIYDSLANISVDTLNKTLLQLALDGTLVLNDGGADNTIQILSQNDGNMITVGTDGGLYYKGSDLCIISNLVSGTEGTTTIGNVNISSPCAGKEELLLELSVGAGITGDTAYITLDTSFMDFNTRAYIKYADLGSVNKPVIKVSTNSGGFYAVNATGNGLEDVIYLEAIGSWAMLEILETGEIYVFQSGAGSTVEPQDIRYGVYTSNPDISYVATGQDLHTITTGGITYGTPDGIPDTFGIITTHPVESYATVTPNLTLSDTTNEVSTTTEVETWAKTNSIKVNTLIEVGGVWTGRFESDSTVTWVDKYVQVVDPNLEIDETLKYNEQGELGVKEKFDIIAEEFIVDFSAKRPTQKLLHVMIGNDVMTITNDTLAVMSGDTLTLSSEEVTIYDAGGVSNEIVTEGIGVSHVVDLSASRYFIGLLRLNSPILEQEKDEKSWENIEYSFYIQGSQLYAYESPNFILMGSLSVGDTLLLVPEKKDIVYYQNGNELRRIVGVVDYSENKVTIDTILKHFHRPLTLSPTAIAAGAAIDSNQVLSLTGGGATVDYCNSLKSFQNVVNLACEGATNGSDVTTIINTAFAAGNDIFVPTGSFVVSSTITIPDNRKIFGNGQDAIIQSAITGAIFEAGTSNEFKNFQINGVSSANGGIGISQNDGTFTTNGLIAHGVKFSNLNTGIFVANEVNLHSGGNIESCTFLSNIIGVDLSNRGEYYLVSSSTFISNTTGLQIAGGNAVLNACNVNDNTTGVSIIAGSNDSHGNITGCNINHNGTNLNINTISSGYTVTGTHFYAGGVTLTNSDNVRFLNCVMDSDFTETGSEGSMISSSFFETGFTKSTQFAKIINCEGIAPGIGKLPTGAIGDQYELQITANGFEYIKTN